MDRSIALRANAHSALRFSLDLLLTPSLSTQNTSCFHGALARWKLLHEVNQKLLAKLHVVQRARLEAF
jgi:hypothetical protein